MDLVRIQVFPLTYRKANCVCRTVLVLVLVHQTRMQNKVISNNHALGARGGGTEILHLVWSRPFYVSQFSMFMGCVLGDKPFHNFCTIPYEIPTVDNENYFLSISYRTSSVHYYTLFSGP